MRMAEVYAWPQRHRRAIDRATAGLLVLTLVPASVASVASSTASGWLIGGLALTQLAPLAVRRTHPALAFWVVLVSCLAQILFYSAPIVANVAALVMAFSVASYCRDGRVRIVGLVSAVVAGPLAVADWGISSSGSTSLLRIGGLVFAAFLSGTAVVSWVAGDLLRNRRAVVERLAEQNEALRRERDQRVAMAAQDERTRIAREMHDIVAHSLSVIVVQADGGAYAAEHAATWERDQSRQTLQTVADTARNALSETRRLVGVLRDERGGTGDIDYAPTSSLAELPDLVGRIRDSGLAVQLEVSGPQARLPREVDLAAYRVVQESLTNVLKHAGPSAAARVSVVHGPEVWVEVVDDGRGAAAGVEGGGNGIIGMRERAASVGGRLEAGPQPGGGFAVRAVLPVGGAA